MNRVSRIEFEQKRKNFPVVRGVWKNDFQVIKISVEQGAHFVF